MAKATATSAAPKQSAQQQPAQQTDDTTTPPAPPAPDAPKAPPAPPAPDAPKAKGTTKVRVLVTIKHGGQWIAPAPVEKPTQEQIDAATVELPTTIARKLIAASHVIEV